MADAAAERDLQLERLRRWGVVLVAALVLFPPRLVIILGVGVGAVYVCLKFVRAISIGDKGAV